RSVGSNANYAFLTNAGAGTTAFTDSGLVDGTQYYYRVLAFNTGGSSSYSNERSAITTLNSPTALTATTVSSSQINLTWTDNSSSETGFKIERSPVNDLYFTQIATVGANVTTFTDSGLAESTKYYYRVRAYNAMANSTYTSEKNATTLSNLPMAPSGLTATVVSSSKITLTWTDNSNNETGFIISRKTGSGGTYADIHTTNENMTTWSDTTVVDGTQYYYKVRATNSAGDSPNSNEVNGIAFLAAPTAFTVTAVSSSQIRLSWTDNSATETGFKIERSPVNDLHFTQIATVGANVTTFTDSSLTESTKYYYRVRAYNAMANSTYTSEKNATTLYNIPLAPSGLRVTSTTSSKVFLAWTDNSGNETGFRIQRKQGATGTYTEIATPGANVTTYTDNDSALLDGTQYYYKVCAYNPAGNSPFSNEVNGITLLSSPTSLTATAVSSSQVNLTWTDNSRTETAYLVERKATSSGNYAQIGSVGMNVHSYTDTYNFGSGTTYYYRVRATNGTIYSGYSNEPHVKPNP
ncbi:MAG TPA: fibronectin type III domain-containing protein, partial [Candidatus Udaeobacter sp.]